MMEIVTFGGGLLLVTDCAPPEHRPPRGNALLLTRRVTVDAFI